LFLTIFIFSVILQYKEYPDLGFDGKSKIHICPSVGTVRATTTYRDYQRHMPSKIQLFK
jgi:hypothetical protein